MESGRVQDRRRARHDETARLIVTAAWQLAEAEGLAGLSVGQLARAMHMRPQSLYTYFPSKRAIYDRMYREGFEHLLERFAALGDARPEAPADFLTDAMSLFIDFSAALPSRYQLLFQRTVPGFEPTPESYAVATTALTTMRGWLHALGITEEAHLDLWRALLLGLAGEQLANDPGGHRWRDLTRRTARYFIGFTTEGKDHHE